MVVQKFAVCIELPPDETGDYVASWILNSEAEHSSYIGKPIVQHFATAAEAVRWLDIECRKNGFSTLLPLDLETRMILVNANYHGVE